MPKLVFLATDIVLCLLFLAMAAYAWHVQRTPALRQTWRQVLRHSAGDRKSVV